MTLNQRFHEKSFPSCFKSLVLLLLFNKPSGEKFTSRRKPEILGSDLIFFVIVCEFKKKKLCIQNNGSKRFFGSPPCLLSQCYEQWVMQSVHKGLKKSLREPS